MGRHPWHTAQIMASSPVGTGPPVTSELVELAPDRGAVQRARSFVADLLERAGLSGSLVDDVELCTSELVSNAVVHARTPIELRVTASESDVRVEVRDSSTFAAVPPAEAGVPPLYDPLLARLPERSGLGLLMVSRLARQWGVDPTPDGKTVWARFLVDRQPTGPVPGEVRVPAMQPASILPPDDWPEIEIRDIPVRLLAALESHVRDLVHEAHVVLGSARQLDRVSADDPVELVVATMDRYWSTMRTSWAQARLVGRTAPGRSNFTTKLPASTAEDGPRFLDALDAADRLSREDQLLTLPAGPELVEFRRWFVGAMVRQVRGGEPEACPFPV